MSKRKSKHRSKPKVPKLETLRADANQAGVPMFLPTEERAERGDLVVERVVGWSPQGDRPGRKPPRRVTIGYAVRDRASSAKTRLRRFKDLTAEQIEAGVRLEADWEASGLEPRMVANLLRSGGGRAGDVSPMVIDARTRVQLALNALRLGGDEVLRVVEAVVLKGATSAEASAPRYADAEKGRVHTAALLVAGLSLLAAHYRLGVRRLIGAK